jgi:hypothetical protein
MTAVVVVVTLGLCILGRQKVEEAEVGIKLLEDGGGKKWKAAVLATEGWARAGGGKRGPG